jgi:hypothetical protein
MDDYKEVLFKSMLLVQGVEGLVRDCILKLVAKGQIERSDIELEKIKKCIRPWRARLRYKASRNRRYVRKAYCVVAGSQ